MHCESRGEQGVARVAAKTLQDCCSQTKTMQPPTNCPTQDRLDFIPDGITARKGLFKKHVFLMEADTN